MKKNEFSDVLSRLERAEFEDLGRYIHSPYFHVQSRIIKAYDILLLKYESALEGKLSRDEFGRNVLDDIASDQSVRKLISDLLKVIDEYLIQKEFEDDIDARQIALLRRLKEKKDTVRFSRKASDFEKARSGIGVYDERYYRFYAYLKTEVLESEPETDFHKYSAALQSKADNIDMYFISEKLHIYQLMFSKQYLNVINLGYRWEFWKEIERFILKNEIEIKKSHPEIFLRYVMLKMLDFKNDNSFQEYVTYLESLRAKLSKQQLSRYYSDLYNYLTIIIGKGEYKYRKPFLELIKKLHRLDLLTNLKDGKITYYSFKQIVDTCIHLRDLEWLEFFLKQYEDKLDAENRIDIINLVYAKFHYYKNDFQAARSCLSRVGHMDFIHYLDAKQLLACIEYDDMDFNEVLLIINAIKKYIRIRKDIPRNFVSDSNDFLRYLTELIHINETDNKKEKLLQLGLLAGRFETEKANIYARNWLGEKIKELKKIAEIYPCL